MVRNLAYLVIGTFLFSGCLSFHETKREIEDEPAVVNKIQQDKKPPLVLRHVVLFRFKEGTTNQQIREFENAFCSIPSKISAISDFEWGTNTSIEDRSDGFTHCFMLTFLSEADRAQYIPHPAHKELGSMFQPYLDKVL